MSIFGQAAIKNKRILPIYYYAPSGGVMGNNPETTITGPTDIQTEAIATQQALVVPEGFVALNDCFNPPEPKTSSSEVRLKREDLSKPRRVQVVV